MTRHPFVCFVFMLLLVLSASADTTDAHIGHARGQDSELERDTLSLKPTVMAVFLARNKAHALPYFLGYFERLRYPKDRISIWSVSHSVCCITFKPDNVRPIIFRAPIT